MIDLRTLEVFYWVARLGGFGRAAERLHTTQPAISARIAQAELAVGARLLEREGGRRPTPTAKGAELLAYAERALALQAEMTAALADPRAGRRTLRLGVSETVVHTFLADLVQRARAVCGDVVLDITVDVSGALRTALLEGAVDLALLLGPVAEPEVENRPLVAFDLVWAAAPAVADALGAGPLSLAALTAVPIITYARPTRPYVELAGLCAAAGVPAARLFSSSSLAATVRMATEGIGVAVLPAAVIGAELARGALRVLDAAPRLAPLVFTASFLPAPGGCLASVVAGLAAEAARDGA